MKALLVQTTRRSLMHLLFWAGVWFFFFYFFSYNSDDTAYVTWFSSFLLPLTMAVTYLMVNFLIPKYLLTRKYWLFALHSFYTLVISSYLIVLIIYGCLIFLLQFNIQIMPPMSKNFFFILILVFLVVALVAFVSILRHNFKVDAQNKALQNKILNTQLQLKEQELHYLKRQIHPHFLFNTLNTIYGFALQQNNQTPDIILKLSNLLDYILYQVSKPKVSLKEELLHIKEYIELEKMRFRDTLKTILSISDVNEKIQIAPMMLIPFVENAFKHGSLIDGYLRIEINVSVEGTKLDFFIRNSVLKHEINQDNGGIGLENIRKRLELHYPENHDLKIKKEGDWYSVHLCINKLKSD
jgi:sensor histidine kinase YesM